MKPILLLASLTLAAVPCVSHASTELEMLRAQRAQIDGQIQSLQKGESTVDRQATVSRYTVKKGDSIERIARKTGASPAAIASANGMKKGTMIHPGQSLKIPGGKAQAPVAAATASAPASTPATQKYTVREGETFYSIAKKNKMSTAALMAANPGVKANALRPGIVLKLKSKPAAVASSPARSASTTPVIAAKAQAPAEKTVEAPAQTTAAPAPQPKTQEHLPAPKPAAQTAAASPAPAPASTPKPAAPPSPAPVAQETTTPGKVRPVTIDGEMTYGQFATKHGTSPQRLNELNGLDLSDATLLAKGSELYIPAQP